jgi:hypothetical protein
VRNSFSFILLISVFFLSYTARAQHGKLRVYIQDSDIENDCYELSVTKELDTFYRYTITNDDLFEVDDFVIDSLTPGLYLISFTNCGDLSTEQLNSVTSYVEIKADQLAQRSFYLGETTRYFAVDPETDQEIVRSRSEFQTEFSYFDFRWNPDGNNPKFNVGIAMSGYMWQSFSKHVGFLIGGGYGWEFAQLQIDQQTAATYPDEVKSNYYNYIYGKTDMRMRFSFFDQQSPKLKGHNVFLDLGAQYNFPFYFKRITRFSIKDKLVNSFIHRYSDLRLFANFGVTNIQVFASYRPFDFINKDLPQFPRYNFGLKVNLQDW